MNTIGRGCLGLLVLGLAVARAQVAPTNAPPPPPIFQDPDRPLAERVADLVGRMTLEEKAAYMGVEAPAIPRLGLPAYSWRNEGNHGICRSGRATVFPQASGLAATWNTDLVYRVASATSDEARLKHREAPTQTFHGLTYWAPVTDLVRDPRWGRAQDTYGEDPFLVSRCAVAYVRGLQGNDPKYLKIAATPKHFAVYGQETERASVNLEVPERALREYYLVPFHAAFVEGKAASVMTAFPGVNGAPCAANRRLVTDILRHEWGFQGPAVTDLGAVNHVREHFKLAATAEEAMAKVVGAGLDVLGTSGQGVVTPVLAAVRSGALTVAQLDESLKRSLALRFRLGMFDPPERVPWTKIPDSALGSPEHVRLALEAGRQCLVLLKNAPVPNRADPAPLLPLDVRKLESVAVVGPYADRLELGHVASDVTAEPAVTVLRGIQERVGDRVAVRTAAWFRAESRPRRKGEAEPRSDAGQKAAVEAALKMAARSDVVVAAVGNGQKHEWEGRDRLDLGLPPEQQEFVEKLFEANPAMVLVLFNGGALSVNWAQKNAPAILEAWYPGEQGGRAVAEALFGDVNPAGRMPLTTFASVEQLPPITECEVRRGRTYLWFKGAPLYPFGHGLSYTRFEYGGLRLDRERARATDSVLVSAEVRNVGGRDGDEVVQLYVKGPGAGETSPIHQLRGFQRVAIPAGQSRKVSFPLRVADLALWSEEKRGWAVVPGAYEAQVGASSADLRLRGAFRVE
jgi:beta-glucosidase